MSKWLVGWLWGRPFQEAFLDIFLCLLPRCLFCTSFDVFRHGPRQRFFVDPETLASFFSAGHGFFQLFTARVGVCSSRLGVPVLLDVFALGTIPVETVLHQVALVDPHPPDGGWSCRLSRWAVRLGWSVEWTPRGFPSIARFAGKLAYVCEGLCIPALTFWTSRDRSGMYALAVARGDHV